MMEEDTAGELRKKADLSESHYTAIKKEFRDYIETSRRNEEIRKKELRADSAKKMLTIADSLCRMPVMDKDCSCDIVKNYSENFQKNLDVIYQQLLSASGLTPVDPAPGDTFDDTRHMAVGLEYGSLYPENTVFRVIRKGYCSGDVVIRPAEVIISKRPYESTNFRKTGIWKKFTNWLFPSKGRFAGLDQQMDELKHAQSQKNLVLQQEMEGLQDFIAQSVAEKQKMDELCQLQGEKIEQLDQEIEALHDLLTEAEADNRKSCALGQVLNEKTEELEREIIALKKSVTHETGEKQKIREIEDRCYEMMHQFEQKFSAPGNIASSMGEDKGSTQPVTGKKQEGTTWEIPVQNNQIPPPGTGDQINGDDEPVFDDVTYKDQINEDDEPVSDEDSRADHHSGDAKIVLDEDINDDNKKYP